MKILFNTVAVSILMLALLSPFFIEQYSRINIFLSLILLTAVTAVSLGFWWFFGVRRDIKDIVSASSANEALNEVLRKRNIYILPIGRSAFSKNVVICVNTQSVMTLVSKIFIPSFWFALAAMGVGAMAGILLQEFRSSRGFFGNLLQSQVGTGVALAMCVYVSFVGITLFVVGFLAFINKGEAK